MKKIYDQAIKDLMPLLIQGHGPKGPEAPHGVQIHIHGASPVDETPAPTDPDADPSATDLGLPPLGQDEQKHKAEMAALHAKRGR